MITVSKKVKVKYNHLLINQSFPRSSFLNQVIVYQSISLNPHITINIPLKLMLVDHEALICQPWIDVDDEIEPW